MFPKLCIGAVLVSCFASMAGGVLRPTDVRALRRQVRRSTDHRRCMSEWIYHVKKLPGRIF